MPSDRSDIRSQSELPADLAHRASIWDELPEATRAAIITLAKAALK